MRPFLSANQAIVLTFEALEGLEHLDELDGPKDIGVFRGNLDYNLQILADVDTEHLLQAGESLLGSEPTEVLH